MPRFLKKRFDPRGAKRSAVIFALMGGAVSILISIFEGETTTPEILAVAGVCALVNTMVGSLIGGYTTIWDKDEWKREQYSCDEIEKKKEDG